MLTKAVVVKRKWHNGADCIRHTLPVLSQGKDAENEAMIAALSFWDPWQRRGAHPLTERNRMQNETITGYEVTRQERGGSDAHQLYKQNKLEAIAEANRLSYEGTPHEFRVFPCYHDKQRASFGESVFFRSRCGQPSTNRYK